MERVYCIKVLLSSLKVVNWGLTIIAHLNFNKSQSNTVLKYCIVYISKDDVILYLYIFSLMPVLGLLLINGRPNIDVLLLATIKTELV